jgi:signal transduction histidine kinase
MLLDGEEVWRIVRDVCADSPATGMFFENSIRVLTIPHCPVASFCDALLPHGLEQSLASMFSSCPSRRSSQEVNGPYGLRIVYEPLDDAVGRLCGIFVIAAHSPPDSSSRSVTKALEGTDRLRKKVIKRELDRASEWKHPKLDVLSAELRSLHEATVRMIDDAQERAFEDAVTSYKDFVSSFSHEVLSPIQEISNTLEFAANKAVAPDVRTMLSSGLDAIDSLRVSIEGMRLLFRDKSQMPLDNQFRQVNLRSVVERWATIYRAQFQAKNINVILEPASSKWMLNCVQEYMEVLVRNLISNAIKYSFDASAYDAGKILVRFEQFPLSLSVVSFGVPIKQDEIDSGRIFKMESRGLSANDRGRVGRGVGLYLVRQVADLHRASIEVRSQIQNPSGRNVFARNEFRVVFPS